MKSSIPKLRRADDEPDAEAAAAGVAIAVLPPGSVRPALRLSSWLQQRPRWRRFSLLHLYLFVMGYRWHRMRQ